MSNDSEIHDVSQTVPFLKRPRFVITGLVVFSVLTIILSVISLLFNRTNRGLKKDSYGLYRQGHLAAFELLNELSIPVSRRHTPLLKNTPTDATLILNRPFNSMANTEPRFLEELKVWINNGGRVLVFPQLNRDVNQSATEFEIGSAGFLMFMHQLGVSGLLLNDPTKTLAFNETYAESSYKGVRKDVLSVFQDNSRPSRSLKIQFDGDFEALKPLISEIQIYEDALVTLSFAGEPTGTISIRDDQSDDVGSGVSKNIGASFSVGEGEIIVFSMASITDNRLIAEKDNSALFVALASHQRKMVVFDEFFHGGIVKGNVFYLFTEPAYATVFICFLAAVVVWGVRQGFFLGPGKPISSRDQRSLYEYVTAMSRFLAKGKGSSRYLLIQLRNGLLFQAGVRCGMAINERNADEVLHILERREPELGAKVKESIRQLDRSLTQAQISKSEITRILQEYPSCL